MVHICTHIDTVTHDVNARLVLEPTAEYFWQNVFEFCHEEITNAQYTISSPKKSRHHASPLRLALYINACWNAWRRFAGTRKTNHRGSSDHMCNFYEFLGWTQVPLETSRNPWCHTIASPWRHTCRRSSCSLGSPGPPGPAGAASLLKMEGGVAP